MLTFKTMPIAWPSIIFKRFFKSACRKRSQFVQFSASDTPGLGVLKEDYIVDFGSNLPDNLIGLLEADTPPSKIERIISEEKCVRKLNDVKLLAPVTKPDKVICVGLNYKGHCDEQKKPYPKEPFFFNKFPSTIVAANDVIKYPSKTKALDWEVELAVIMGKKCRNIEAGHAYDYVFGYAVAQDISARDWQTQHKNNGQWLIGKSMDTFCPLGPAVVSKNDIPDPHNLDISCYINGVPKQRANTRELIHRIDALIAFLSGVFTMLPGDVILTGTPSGVGVFRNPREFLKPGDVVRSEISSIGILENRVV